MSTAAIWKQCLFPLIAPYLPRTLSAPTATRVKSMYLDSAIIVKFSVPESDSGYYAALRTLDAIHIATCMKTGSFPLVTNDKMMRKAAEELQILLAQLPQ
jgi:hypothetical protein